MTLTGQPAAAISTPPTDRPTPAPTGPAGRYRFLDVLRGVALLGILPANIALMALPVTIADQPHAVTASGWREPLAYYTTGFLFDYKFITIFSLLFGVGLALIHQRCQASARSFRILYLRRIAVLGAFALGHVTLLWMGDILGYYAALGFVAMWMADWSPRRLRRTGLAILCVPLVVMLLMSGLLLFTQDHAAVSAALADWTAPPAIPVPAGGCQPLGILERLEHFGPDLEWYVYTQGSFAEIAILRLVTWLGGAIFPIGPYFGWRILGLFLIGMSLLKSGWFVRPAEHPRRFARLGRIGFAAGIPLQAAWLAQQLTGAGGYAGACLAEGALYTGSLGLSAGYIALVARLSVARASGGWCHRFAAVGRTALSNYILQSLLCTCVFYAYGLALFATLDRLQLWLVVAAAWTVQLTISPLWTRRFRFGPLEWLWRCLTYGPAAMVGERRKR